MCGEREVGPGMAGKAMAFRVHSFHALTSRPKHQNSEKSIFYNISETLELFVTEGKKKIFDFRNVASQTPQTLGA